MPSFVLHVFLIWDMLSHCLDLIHLVITFEMIKNQEGNDEFEAWMLVAGENEKVSITVSFLSNFQM